jgi:Dolichyl-phosphate-mannose-protein mannosyltransferase
LLLAIPLALSAFTSLWNPLGFPSMHIDEGHYMRKAMSILDGTGIDPLHRYAAPYFGQIFLAGVLGMVGYPDSLNLSDTGGDDVLHSVERLYLAPRVLMGLLAVADTFFIYKITERRYHNRNVALIAAILFAVMPFGWLFRRIFLETIQVPFLLMSILLAVYVKDFKIEKNNNAARYKAISMILLSGAFLGLSIFTKVPVFTMIPLVGFLIYTNNTNGHKLRNLGLWFIPVILIPLIWPAHAMIIGEFDQWIHGILWQTTGRPSSPLSGTLKTFFQDDPILFVIGMAGLIYAAVKRDFFLLLWVIPFLIFLYFIGYVSPFHLMPLIPAFCIAASRLLVELPSKIKIIKKHNIQQILPFAIISGIIIFGLVSTAMLITTNVNSAVYKALAVIVQKLPTKDDTNSTNSVSLVASPIYFTMPRHGFDKAFYDRSMFSGKSLETERYILVADSAFKKLMSNTERRSSTVMKSLYDNSQTVDILVPDDKTKYSLKKYPYPNMRQNPGAAKEIEIRSNY